VDGYAQAVQMGPERKAVVENAVVETELRDACAALAGTTLPPSPTPLADRLKWQRDVSRCPAFARHPIFDVRTAFGRKQRLSLDRRWQLEQKQLFCINPILWRSTGRS
jgi:hypothetical protein